ncbi:hypothetical protein GLOIN_2v1472929 [Rhizophagus clarus]|uniref:DNA-directed DNA polymerase n=1 Tax=Rhizophagus clarus TaxID=94130 RepID=A0A8H3LBM0_9GLOM|nr:hypothetical protein GLOIN_2v1472929 [Rhizophagus clarus]
MLSRLVRHLPNRPDIIEVKYSGRKQFQILLPYENWKPGQWTTNGEDANLFSLLDHYDASQLPDNIGDPERFDNFIIYMRDSPAVSGGCGDTNDCLYQCLKMVYGSYSNMPQKRLARSIAINVVGDHTYISKSPAQRRITLTLTNGHYSLALNPDRKHPSFECKRPKKPITYQENEVKDTIHIYNGKEIKPITVQQFQKLKFSKNYSFILAKRQESLEKAYIRINAERDAFLQETKKLGIPIDISLLDWNIKRMTLWLFEKLSVGIPANKPLDALEAQWISKAMMGGIIWAQNNWEGYERSYDETSLYPSIQGYSHFGIFRASIEKKDTLLFRYNYHNVYTHIDLTRAKALGLQVTLIQDGASNALIYEKETRIRGSVIFEEYVDFLFKIKNQGGIAGQVAKRILNTLWGALCQRKKTYKTLTTSSKSFDFLDGKVLDSIVPIGEEQWRFQFTNPGNPFKGEYPRIAPFLLAHGRKFISETVQPYVDKVRRIHIDGFILEEDVNSSLLIACAKDAFKTLKALKFEKEGECVILAGLQDGYGKESYLIKNHVNYMKKIESANNPEGYIHYTAKKLLPNKESYHEKIAKIQAKYSFNPDLAFRIIKVYDLYKHIPKETKEAPPRHKLTEDEAEDVLDELLGNKL